MSSSTTSTRASITARRRPLAAAMLVALCLPGLAFAQTAKERELEARIAELEKMVQQLAAQQQQTQGQVTEVKAAQAAVIVKVGRHLAKVRRVVERLGLAAQARYIERATLPEQRVFALAEMPGETAPYFSLVFVQNGGAVKDL